MSLSVLGEGAGPGGRIPAHLTRISISSLSTSSDCSDRVVKGTVLHKGRLVSSQAHNFLLKTVIQEEGSCEESSISVVLFGALAKAFSEAVSPGDVVAAAGFSVRKSPTVHKDKLHACNLLLSGEQARIYLFYQSTPPTPSPRKRSSAPPSQLSKTPKYSYVPLDQLTVPAVVNVFGVVIFFKQPFRSRGTDWCSSLKITDESDRKVGCTLFSPNPNDHPVILKNGDIIRLHRVKTQLYNDTLTLINTHGFSALTFDGAPGGEAEPRTSSRSFHFSPEDRRRVEELRLWAGGRAASSPDSAAVRLASVRPRAFFDLVCQLLAKAPVDSTCTLLRVWDGTRCPHAQAEVAVEAKTVEGPTSFARDKEGLIANVLVYDNHVESARQFKPGDFLRIYNLRSLQGSSKDPSPAQPLTFHLHGGTSYGRGIRVLSENSPEVQELKRTLEDLSKDTEEPFSNSDSDLLDVWGTPPEFLGEGAVKCWTERSCGHALPLETLSEVKRGAGGLVQNVQRVHHVHVQLLSYRPHRLHQALKLHCSCCNALRDVPDEDQLSQIFREGSLTFDSCAAPSFLLSGQVQLPGRSVNVFLLSDFLKKELLFIQGSPLPEVQVLAGFYQNLVPVRSSGGRLSLLDLKAPFLFRGRRRFYGCVSCSRPSLKEPVVAADQLLDESKVAEALGVQLLRPVLVLQLKLQDDSDSLDVLLFKEAESFFGVSADSLSVDQTSQDLVSQTLNSLCPSGDAVAQRPYLDLCLSSYRVEDTEDHDPSGRLCVQIVHSRVVRE